MISFKVIDHDYLYLIAFDAFGTCQLCSLYLTCRLFSVIFASHFYTIPMYRHSYFVIEEIQKTEVFMS